MPADIDVRCTNCGGTAFYRHEERPRCVRCEEVERSVMHYISFPEGLCIVEHALREKEKEKEAASDSS